MVEQNTLPHTLLFYGPQGIGKHLTALRLAEAMLGPSSKFASGNHPDLHQLYPEGKGNLHPVENIRALIKEAAYPPLESPVKFFLIHDAHQMQGPSANALLKTLEEPVPHTYFILLTHQMQALLPTIVSRARPIAFFPIADQEIAAYAQKHWNKTQAEAQRIAFLSHGSFAKAHQLAFGKPDELRTLVRAFVTPQPYPNILSLCEQIETFLTPDEDTPSRVEEFFEEVLAWYRDLHLLKNGIAPEYLYHFDALEHLQQSPCPPPLEHIFHKISTLRDALQRHVKLRTCLEHFLGNNWT